MPKKTKTEWKTINHESREGPEPSEIYFLKRTRDGSKWIAFKAEEYQKLLNRILAHLEKMDEILKRPVFGGPTQTTMASDDVFCTNCGRKETRDHNYCGRCGTTLPRS